MSRYYTTIHSERERASVQQIVAAAPVGSRVEVKGPKRSTAQNSKMWACLTDIALQLPWGGRKLRPDDWKIVFIQALHREPDLVPTIDGQGFVDLGSSSSDLSKEEMSNLIELILAFGTEHGVKFHDDARAA